MTKKEQSVELHRRVRQRLLDSPDPALALKSFEIVLGFLICLEELQDMQRSTLPDGIQEVGR